MIFSWALELDVGVDYFLVLTDSACFHICRGFISGLSHVVCIKHKYFTFACASAQQEWRGAVPPTEVYESLCESRLARRKYKIIKVLKASLCQEMNSVACFSQQMTLLRCE